MRGKLMFSLLAVVFFIISCAPKEKYQVVQKTDTNGYKYEIVTNDPMGVRIYTLANGLKVYLSVNKDEPRIKTFIPVKAGSSYDPAETTGLAHYLEHMMFKGSDEIGTTNWEKEKPLIQEISNLYEQHKAAKGKEAKAKIYAKIDSVSTLAAKYAVANEYDKLVAVVGAKGTNAYTSQERTVYMNDIPSNELEKWLEIEKERFSGVVLRIFHTELETVYEEFNMYQDEDADRVNNTIMSNLFKKHPYGTQTTLGKAEHLKNPSMVNIMDYFHTYYVPNNMAIALSGDLDFEKTIQLIDKTFGTLKAKPVPEFKAPVEAPITAPIVKEVLGPDAESLEMAFRFDGIGSRDQKIVTIIDGILNNSKAGLIDLNLNQKQKVLRAGCYTDFMIDYGYHGFFGMPREGQRMEEVKDLILAQIEKIKKGEFDDWLIEAIINNHRLNQIRRQESNWRAHEFAATFANNVSWADNLKEIDELEKITKEEVIQFVKEHYKNNYVLVYKRKGEDKNIVKVEKPKITPAAIDRKSKSKFYEKLTAQKTPALKPLWLDYKKDIQCKDLKAGMEFDYLKNNSNELFKLFYIYDMGKNHNKKLPLAVNYLPYLGTDKYSAEDLQKEMFKYGLSLGVNTNEDRCYVYITGLKKSLDKGIELIEHILSNLKADQDAYDKYVDGILKKRSDRKLNKDEILWGALMNYGKYGENSSYTNIIPADELKKIDPQSLTSLLGGLKEYKHRVFYYGSHEKSEIENKLMQQHKVADQLKDIPAPVVYPEANITENEVYFVDYDMVQANIIMLGKDEELNVDLMPEIKLFNEYYGGSMASIVFQEIRESRALAYTAFSTFTTPSKPKESHYSLSYVATSADKVNDATTALLDLLNKMPKEQKQFDEAKGNMLKKIESERITKDRVFWNYLNNKDRGIDYDVRKTIYDKVKKDDLNILDKFFTQHVANKKHRFLVIGNKKDINMKVLKKLGKVHMLNLEQIFNY